MMVVNLETVYLAGKMTGLSEDEINGWREEARAFLQDNGFKVLNPADNPYRFDPEVTPKEIVANNKYQIDHSDIILAELDHLAISHGTNAEIVYAGVLGKPVIVWGRNEEIAATPWIAEHTTRRFIELQDALEYIVCNWGL